MQKRGMILGTYDTAMDGWTLSEWKLSSPEYVSNIVEVPGRVDGPIDLSTALTGGEPRYKSRTLTATFERSDGNRNTRTDKIMEMINWVDGWRLNITLPDDPEHYLTGRIHAVIDYNDMAHAAVSITATCDPWRYASNETVVYMEATADRQRALLTNSGRRAVVPKLVVTGSGSISLRLKNKAWTVKAGSYQYPEIVLSQGEHELHYSGAGMGLTVTYREGLL